MLLSFAAWLIFLPLLLSFLKKDFIIYLIERERETESTSRGRGEGRSRLPTEQGEDAGLDLRTPRSWLELKADD